MERADGPETCDASAAEELAPEAPGGADTPEPDRPRARDESTTEKLAGPVTDETKARNVSADGPDRESSNEAKSANRHAARRDGA